jgi:hypothetical protein
VLPSAPPKVWVRATGTPERVPLATEVLVEPGPTDFEGLATAPQRRRWTQALLPLGLLHRTQQPSLLPHLRGLLPSETKELLSLERSRVAVVGIRACQVLL